MANQQTHEQRRETLLAYYRALAVVESRFPISKRSGHIDVSFSWADAFKTHKKVSIANVHLESRRQLQRRQLVPARPRRGPHHAGGDQDGRARIQRAGRGVRHAARRRAREDWRRGRRDATADLSGVRWHAVSLHLAQAQECFYDKAATDGKSTAVCVKLAQQTHLFYEEVKTALASPPLSEHLEKSWLAHVAAKSAMFHAEALSRAAKMAEDDDEDIGSAIARLLVASTELHAAHRMTKNTGGSASTA